MAEDANVVSAEFKAVLLGFVKSHDDSEAVEIIEVGGYGTDWAGDTEGGFYSSFDASIRWRRADGSIKSRSYQGEDMGELWDYVIKGVR